jgi:hypothetical protein
VEDQPQAHTEGIVSEWVDEELVIYDTSAQTVHALSAVAAAVWELCDGQHTPEGIRRELALEGAITARALEELRACGLLDDGPSRTPGISRREAAKRLAKVGGVTLAAPLIISAAVPAIAAACVECNVNADCLYYNSNGTLTCNNSEGVCV